MTEQEQNIGLVLCNCGAELFTQQDAQDILSRLRFEGYANIESIVQPNVCGTAGLEAVVQFMQKKRVQRVVFAGCSLMRSEGIRGDLSERLGISPSNVFGVNLKERIFQKKAEKGEKSEYAAKAISKGIRSLSLLPLFKKKTIPLVQHTCIVGGGIAGLHAAHALVSMGQRVTVLERNRSIGGGAFESGTDRNAPLAAELAHGIDIRTEAELVRVAGAIGCFEVSFRKDGTLHPLSCGAIIIATGSALRERAEDRLSQVLRSGNALLLNGIASAAEDLPKRKHPHAIGIVLDFERDETKASTEVALSIAKSLQDGKHRQVFLFCRDVRVSAKELEKLYDDARDAGVFIVKYEGALAFAENESTIDVAFRDSILGRDAVLTCDLLGFSPSGFSLGADVPFAENTGLATDAYGFLQENNIHLFPEKSNIPGIYVIGACRGQMYLPQVIEEAKAAALSVYNLLAKKEIEVELSNAEVDADACALCLTCIRTCPFKAMRVNAEKAAAESAPEACRRCGICVGECPAKAITLPVYSDALVLSQIEVDV